MRHESPPTRGADEGSAALYDDDVERAADGLKVRQAIRWDKHRHTLG